MAPLIPSPVPPPRAPCSGGLGGLEVAFAAFGGLPPPAAVPAPVIPGLSAFPPQPAVVPGVPPPAAHIALPKAVTPSVPGLLLPPVAPMPPAVAASPAPEAAMSPGLAMLAAPPGVAAAGPAPFPGVVFGPGGHLPTPDDVWVDFEAGATALRNFGLANESVVETARAHPGGPACAYTAMRKVGYSDSFVPGVG